MIDAPKIASVIGLGLAVGGLLILQLTQGTIGTYGGAVLMVAGVLLFLAGIIRMPGRSI